MSRSLRRVRKRDEFEELDARLRSSRSKPPRELVRFLSEAADPDLPRFRPTWPRLGLAGCLTLAVLAAFVSLGGFSRTATAASEAAHFVRSGSFSAQSGSFSKAASVQAASDEYEEKVTFCERDRANAEGETRKVSPKIAAEHLKNDPYDYAGPCKDDDHNDDD